MGQETRYVCNNLSKTKGVSMELQQLASLAQVFADRFKDNKQVELRYTLIFGSLSIGDQEIVTDMVRSLLEEKEAS